MHEAQKKKQNTTQKEKTMATNFATEGLRYALPRANAPVCSAHPYGGCGAGETGGDPRCTWRVASAASNPTRNPAVGVCAALPNTITESLTQPQFVQRRIQEALSIADDAARARFLANLQLAQEANLERKHNLPRRVGAGGRSYNPIQVNRVPSQRSTEQIRTGVAAAVLAQRASARDAMAAAEAVARARASASVSRAATARASALSSTGESKVPMTVPVSQYQPTYAPSTYGARGSQSSLAPQQQQAIFDLMQMMSPRAAALLPPPSPSLRSGVASGSVTGTLQRLPQPQMDLEALLGLPSPIASGGAPGSPRQFSTVLAPQLVRSNGYDSYDINYNPRYHHHPDYRLEHGPFVVGSPRHYR